MVDKLIQEITPLGTINYTYDAIGRRTSMTIAGQPAVNYSYDANSRLTGISTLNSALGTLNFNIAYDAIGRRTSLTLPNGVTSNYNYDNASHLLEMKHLSPLSSVLEALNYSYDATGNRTSMNRQGVSLPLRGGVTDTNYNEANQMLKFNASSDNIAYDENGNMVSKTDNCGTTNYTWDAHNRLSSINGFKPDCSALLASFMYDALGRRIEKTVNSVTTQYVYDGLDIVQEIEGSAVTNYIRTLNIDEPLARIKADGSVRYYQQDALGSVIALTDEAGAVKTQYSYDPFGSVTISGEASDNPFQYTGRENDNTGLYYYRARYYSPELQRFISEDPIGFRSGDVNFYSYVGNSPLNWIDPNGLYRLGGGVASPSWELDRRLLCVESCLSGFELTVTSTSGGRHSPGSAHYSGQAVDLRYNYPDSGRLMCCAKKCGFKFGLDEGRNPSPYSSGSHYHIQTRSGSGGRSGDLPSSTSECCEGGYSGVGYTK